MLNSIKPRAISYPNENLLAIALFWILFIINLNIISILHNNAVSMLIPIQTKRSSILFIEIFLL